MTEPTSPHWEELSAQEQNALIEVALSQNHARRVHKRHLVYARLIAMRLLEVTARRDVFVLVQLSPTGKDLLRRLPDHVRGRRFVATEDDIRRIKHRLHSEPEDN